MTALFSEQSLNFIKGTEKLHKEPAGAPAIIFSTARTKNNAPTTNMNGQPAGAPQPKPTDFHHLTHTTESISSSDQPSATSWTINYKASTLVPQSLAGGGSRILRAKVAVEMAEKMLLYAAKEVRESGRFSDDGSETPENEVKKLTPEMLERAGGMAGDVLRVIGAEVDKDFA